MKNVSRGVLVSIEGIDGSGKSTLVHNLAQSLQHHSLPIVLTKEPGGTALGKQLRSILQEQTTPLTSKAEYLLFAADRAQHFETFITPTLAKNTIIISDRMADSSLVYQGFGRGLDRTMLSTINQWAMNTRQPDLIFYVKVDPQIAINRLAQRAQLTAFEKEKESFVHKLAHGFDTLFKDRANVIHLDGHQTPTALTEQATNALLQWLENNGIVNQL